jgi:hypothetical protein
VGGRLLEVLAAGRGRGDAAEVQTGIRLNGWPPPERGLPDRDWAYGILLDHNGVVKRLRSVENDHEIELFVAACGVLLLGRAGRIA